MDLKEYVAKLINESKAEKETLSVAVHDELAKVLDAIVKHEERISALESKLKILDESAAGKETPTS